MKNGDDAAHETCAEKGALLAGASEPSERERECASLVEFSGSPSAKIWVLPSVGQWRDVTGGWARKWGSRNGGTLLQMCTAILNGQKRKKQRNGQPGRDELGD